MAHPVCKISSRFLRWRSIREYVNSYFTYLFEPRQRTSIQRREKFGKISSRKNSSPGPKGGQRTTEQCCDCRAGSPERSNRNACSDRKGSIPRRSPGPASAGTGNPAAQLEKLTLDAVRALWGGMPSGMPSRAGCQPAPVRFERISLGLSRRPTQLVFSVGRLTFYDHIRRSTTISSDQQHKCCSRAE